MTRIKLRVNEMISDVIRHDRENDEGLANQLIDTNRKVLVSGRLGFVPQPNLRMTFSPPS